MKALRVFVIALLCAFLGVFASILASSYLTELYHVSNFEGGRGMLVFFCFGPLGFVGGFVIGLVVALAKRTASYLAAQGMAFGAVVGIACLVSAVAWMLADHPPTIDGKRLALEFELRVPPVLKIADNPDSVRASLYVDNQDNRLAAMEPDRTTREGGYTIIRGRVSLLSQSFNRELLASVGNEGGASQFIKLKLSAKPKKEDEKWSEWITATERADLSPVPEAERIAMRYRVEPEN